MPYNRYAQDIDPQAMMAASGNPFYNPLTGTPNFGGGFSSMLATISGMRRQQEMDAWEKSKWQQEQMLSQRSLDIREAELKANKKIPRKVSKQAVKALMVRLNYPLTAIAGVEEMDDETLADTWDKLQAGFTSITTAGIRKQPTTKGREQLNIINAAANRFREFGQVYRGALTQLMANPMNANLDPTRFKWLQDVVAQFNTTEGEIESMKSRIDEAGELSPEDYAKLQSLVQNPQALVTAPSRGVGDQPDRPGKAVGEEAKDSKTGAIFIWNGVKWVRK